MTVLFLGCQDVTPGERVLGDEVVAHFVEGREGFGQSVAAGFGSILVASPAKIGSGLEELEALALESTRKVGVSEAGFWVWLTDGAVVYGDGFRERVDSADASAVDRCPNGDFVWAHRVGEAVACSSAGVVRTRCGDETCSVHVNDGPAIDEVSPGGDVAWLNGLACWGDPDLEQEQARGRVACEDGFEQGGMAGDHLGITLGADRAAGRFNRHIVPPRLRIVSLVGEGVWLIDRAAENSRVSLAAHDNMTWVGVPQFRAADAHGRLYGVPNDE